MKNFTLASSVLVATLGMQPLMFSHADSIDSVAEMLAEGDTSLSFRYRYEFVDQDGVAKDANASTLKSRLTYKSATYNGLKAVMELDNVTLIGDENYRTPTNGNLGYPIVADPDGTDFNQALLAYKNADFDLTVGRQRIIHGGQRFVGGVGFRQNEQTYDALTLATKVQESVSVNYSYIWHVNRIFGPKDSAVQAKRWQSDSHIFYGTVAPAKDHSVKAYAYWLDFANAAANSSQTVGVEYSGKFDGFSVNAAYASQSDYADNPISYSADYTMAQVTLPLKPLSLSIGYELLGSDKGVAAFKTPLATLHKFQGWADKLLGTPANGVEDIYLKLAGKLGAAKVALFYHDFSSDVGGAALGSELDIVATYPINKNLSVQLKYASYDADNHASDTDKLWFTINAKY